MLTGMARPLSGPSRCSEELSGFLTNIGERAAARPCTTCRRFAHRQYKLLIDEPLVVPFQDVVHFTTHFQSWPLPNIGALGHSQVSWVVVVRNASRSSRHWAGVVFSGSMPV